MNSRLTLDIASSIHLFSKINMIRAADSHTYTHKKWIYLSSWQQQQNQCDVTLVPHQPYAWDESNCLMGIKTLSISMLKELGSVAIQQAEKKRERQKIWEEKKADRINLTGKVSLSYKLILNFMNFVYESINKRDSTHTQPTHNVCVSLRHPHSHTYFLCRKQKCVLI